MLIPTQSEIKDDLRHLRDMNVIVYGSYVRGEMTSRSDIDVAIVTMEQDCEQNMIVWRESLKRMSSLFDLRVFELLPLHIQADIVDDCMVLFGDEVSIHWYFYEHVRRKWKDVKYRIECNRFETTAELIKTKQDALQRASQRNKKK